MALTKCKECNQDVSLGAKTCPNCGANISKKWSIWKRLLLAIFGVWLVAQLAAGFSTVLKDGVPNQPTPKSPYDQALEGLKLDYTWSTGGFDNIMLLDATIKNNSPYAVKDLVIFCDDLANSGTHIDENSKTVYESLASGQTLTLHKFNMGFINSQATRAICTVVGLKLIQAKN